MYLIAMSDGQNKDVKAKPFIGVHFSCCNIYQHINLNAAGTAFVGWCPKCAGKVEVKVSPTGSKSRFFTAG